jgi:hypothetical protein
MGSVIMKNRIASYVLLLTIIFPIANGFGFIPGFISGKIINKMTLEPVENAVIYTSKGRTAITTREGDYILTHETGDFTLFVEKEDFISYTTQVSIIAYETLQMDIFLAPVTATITLCKGINLIAYPVEIPQHYSSYDLLEDIGDSSTVSKIQRYTDEWETTIWLNHHPAGKKFLIDNCLGLAIEMKQAKTLLFSGEIVTKQCNLYENGFHLLGFPGISGEMSSFDLLGQLRLDYNVYEIQCLQDCALNLSAEWFTDKAIGNDFLIQKGSAYIVNIQ